MELKMFLVKVWVIILDKYWGKNLALKCYTFKRHVRKIPECFFQINLPVSEVQCERGHQSESLPLSKMAANVEIDQ
jgi:hypothetical protein